MAWRPPPITGYLDLCRPCGCPERPISLHLLRCAPSNLPGMRRLAVWLVGCWQEHLCQQGGRRGHRSSAREQRSHPRTHVPPPPRRVVIIIPTARHWHWVTHLSFPSSTQRLDSRTQPCCDQDTGWYPFMRQEAEEELPGLRRRNPKSGGAGRPRRGGHGPTHIWVHLREMPHGPRKAEKGKGC